MRELSEKVTLAILSGDLDKAQAAFNIAIGAASMGMDVSMFFTFWGLNIIRKEKASSSSKSLLKRMMGLLNKGGANRLKISKFNMLGIGTRIMKKFMKENEMPTVEEMIKLSKDLGVKLIACTTTMGVMDISKDSLIDEVDKLAGVATFLADAKESEVNLFI